MIVLVLQVHIPNKGFALGPNNEDLVVAATLDSTVSASATGGAKGGFPVTFTSSSLQLGTDPAGIFAKFTDDVSLEEIYVLPDASGDSQKTSIVLCAPALNISTFNASAAPTIFGVSPESYSVAYAAWSSDHSGAPLPFAGFAIAIFPQLKQLAFSMHSVRRMGGS